MDPLSQCRVKTPVRGPSGKKLPRVKHCTESKSSPLSSEVKGKIIESRPILQNKNVTSILGPSDGLSESGS